MHDGEVVASGFVVAGRHGAQALEVMEEDFDPEACSVKAFVEPAAVPLPRGIAADDYAHAAAPNVVYELVGVVAAVADESFALGVGEQLAGNAHFVAVALGERDVERPRLGVDDNMDFGRESASRMTQSVSFDPPFPPDASWCARTTDASTIEPALSTRICNALKTLAQTPRLAQFAKRL